ncbi:HAMP domain-containing sensor histidine kinase [Maridesulfovibrio hydrothermalis]|uniref:HAMP domain-containing sensor histidine kinase n=1 Tax=Maridesulfovibrio hydrothermalis TaxID=191026 RepID=UPI000A55FD80|nr:HAMP domain-containing sensor histidine kinase [Maridesulfovibrio hydrothermalis]
MKFSIKTKLFIAVCVTAAICVSLPLGFAYYLLKADLAADAQSIARQKLELTKRLYLKSDGKSIKARIAAVSNMLGEEVGFISSSGKMLATTLWADESWNLSRSEIRAAKVDGTGFHIQQSPDENLSSIYCAIKVSNHLDAPEGYLIIKESLSTLNERIGMISKVFFWAIPAVALLCYGVIRFVTLHLSSSVKSMVRTAEAVGQGNYKRRIRNFPDKEFIQLAKSINWMAERIDEHVTIITSQKNKIQAVLNGMWDGVMVMDCNCRIQSVNRKLINIFPGAEKGLDRSPLEIIPSPELQDACAEVVSPEGPEAKTVQLVLPTGHIYDVNIVRSPHTVEPGQGPGAIAVFHDISKIKRLETMRQDFVANVSHELRTPLTSIKGYAETLLNEPAPPENIQKSFLETIEKNANHMCKIVDDLLNLSRLESGKEQGHFIPLDPMIALSNAWQACCALAEKRNVKLVAAINKNQFKVQADPDQLMQLFRNLLENAIKYGPENKPVVVNHLVEGDRLKFTVQDEGIGIPAIDQPRIFERFYSVEKFRRNEFGSTGLGLAISRHIVSNHGGKIEVQSPPEGCPRGAAFIFTLPLAKKSA